jgi:hypothetical protein
LVDPRGLHLDASNRLIVADAGANRIFRVATDGNWEIIAGSGERGLSGDTGLATQAALDSPTDARPEPDGSILITDSGNHRIRVLKTIEGATPVVTSTLRVLNSFTGRQDPLVPGQTAFLEADDPFPFATMTVSFGGVKANVVSVTGGRITVTVPTSLAPGWTQVRVEDWAFAPVEILPSGSAVLGEVKNEDGSVNSAEKPAVRTGRLTLRVTGPTGTATPFVTVEIAGIDVPVISVDGVGGQYTVVLQLPGGFLPSGTSPLLLAMDGRLLDGPLKVAIR